MELTIKIILAIGRFLKFIGRMIHSPIDWIYKLIYKGKRKIHFENNHKKEIKHCSIGFAIMFTAAYLAVNAHHIPLPHFFVDGIAYGMHGIGAAPIVKILFKSLNLEELI